MHPAIDDLRTLADELRALLARLGPESDGGWKTSWDRCQEAFARYRADAPRREDLPPEERAALTAALEEVVRLNAVASGLVARESERVLEELRGLASSKRRVRTQRDETDPAGKGRSCDVQG